MNFSFKELDHCLKGIRGSHSEKTTKKKRKILEFYNENLDSLSEELLFNRKRILISKIECHRNVKLPIIITTLFGVIISITTIVYDEFKNGIVGSFLNEVDIIIRSYGFDPANIATINNGELKSIVDYTLLKVWIAFFAIIVLFIGSGYIYYFLMKSSYNKKIVENIVFEYELSIVEELLKKPYEKGLVILRLCNGDNTLVYKLIDVY